MCVTTHAPKVTMRDIVPAKHFANRDGHGSMSMELREQAFGPRKLHYKFSLIYIVD